MRRLLVLSFIWGWSFLFIKVGVEGMTPTAVAGARVALGAAVLHVVLRSKGIRMPRDPWAWRHFVVVGLVGSALPFTMLAWGEERISSALTSVLNASTPLFTAAIAAALLGDRLKKPQLAGLLLGLVGVGVAAGFGRGDLTTASIGGSLASVLAGACYGFTFTWSRKHLMGNPPLVNAAGQLTTATILLAPFAIGTTIVHGIELTPRRIGAILALGILGSGLAYVLSFGVIAELGATKASLTTYLIPIVAVAVGVVVLDEPFQLRIILGGVLIVAGIVLVNTGGRSLRRGALAGVTTALLAALLAGCGGPGGVSGSVVCDPVLREPLDPHYLLHVLPGSEPYDYRTDPPTSGPHQPTPPIEGVVAKPISKPVQIGILEEGRVLLQYRDVATSDRKAIEALAGDQVVVAPNPDLPDDEQVVATAWLTKQTCATVDAEELRTFVEDQSGHGPGSP